MRRLVYSLALAALVASGLAHAQLSPGAEMFGGVAAPGGGAGTAPALAPQYQGQPLAPPTITNLPGIQVPGAAGQSGPEAPREGKDQAAKPRAPSSLETSETNEFQDFIAVSTGRKLPIFGHELFRGVPSTFAPVDNVPVTPDYLIGPGDELYIRAWGQIDVDYRATVDRDGTIAIPRVGVINVAGIKYQDLTGFIKTAVARVFRNFELTVTMGRLRSVQVLVVGQARQPGSYTVSSLSTLVNAIFAAGGPSSRGSMRSIQLKRGNQVVADMDLYDLLVYGDKSKDAALLPGDVIYFAPIGPLVALSGSVNTPAIFELKGDTPIGKLVEWAGGLTSTAQTQLATIERIEERRARIVEQLSLDSAGLAKTVKDGDLVTVYSISPRFENAVTLRGNVAAPLRYPFRQGMRIRDLIPEREALITPDYYLRKNLAVRVEIKGEGRLRNEVKNLLDEINWDYAVVERLNREDLTPKLLPFNLGKAILEKDDEANIELQAGDVVTIFSKDDMAVPIAKRTRLVRLEGEFLHAGVYQAAPGETLKQIIQRAGGLTPNAYLFGAEFTRESTRAQQQKNYDETLNRIERESQLQAAERARSVVSAEDTQALAAQAAAQKGLIARLRQLTPTGRIVLELPESATVDDLPELVLEDGDRLYVPPAPAMVSVFGSVFTESSFLYKRGRTVSDYLDNAGGPTKRADESQIFVLRADGSVVATERSWFGLRLAVSKVMPGDAIVVPEDYERTTFTKNLKDWTQILYQFGLGVAAIKVLRQ
jgi:protein involved in polysaccharide export with SLBB domain